MVESYTSLHKYIFSELTDKKGAIVHKAEIIHYGLMHLRSHKKISFKKTFSDHDKIGLDEKVEKQFENWDKKWSGQYPGPTCDYDANVKKSPTGFTWKQLEEHRNNMARESYAQKGITEITDIMLLTKQFPSYYDYFNITIDPDLPNMKGINFTAIDFETANEFSSSACSLGLAKVVDGQIIKTKHWYIKPIPFIMKPHNEGIHGISLYTLESAPSFESIWAEVLPYLDGQTIVAHNCSFDLDKLNAMLDLYSIDFNVENTFCTMEACKTMWPNASSSLKNMADIFQIDLNHHEAESDASACAELAVKIARLSNITDLRDFIRGGDRTKKAPSPKAIADKELYRSKFSTDTTIPFDIQYMEQPLIWNWSGKRVVISGVFENYDREEMALKLKGMGAIVVATVSGVTDILLAGSDVGPSKLEKAKKMNINIMSESQFDNTLNLDLI